MVNCGDLWWFFYNIFLTIRNLQPNIIFLKMAKTRHERNQCVDFAVF
jgi:hypothetical protein